MAGASGISSKGGPTKAVASAPLAVSSSGASEPSGHSAAIERMRAAARLVNSGSLADVARGERSMGAAIRQLRASRNPSAMGTVVKKAPAALGAGAAKQSAAKVAPKPASTGEKPVSKHGDIHVYKDKGNSYRLVHAASGQQLSDGLSKGAAKALAGHFGMERIKGVGNKNPSNAVFRKAMSGDAKASRDVHEWLAEGRRRSAPKVAVVH